MKKSLIIAAVVLTLSASMAQADSRNQRTGRQQSATPATEQTVATTNQQQALTAQPTAANAQVNRSGRTLQANGRNPMLMQGQRSQVSMSNQNNLSQTGNVGSMVIGNQNKIGRASCRERV